MNQTRAANERRAVEVAFIKSGNRQRDILPLRLEYLKWGGLRFWKDPQPSPVDTPDRPRSTQAEQPNQSPKKEF